MNSSATKFTSKINQASPRKTRDKRVSGKYSSFVNRRPSVPPGSPVLSISRAARSAEPPFLSLLSSPSPAGGARDVG